jgi:hypothetical protein
MWICAFASKEIQYFVKSIKRYFFINLMLFIILFKELVSLERPNKLLSTKAYKFCYKFKCDLIFLHISIFISIVYTETKFQ